MSITKDGTGFELLKIQGSDEKFIRLSANTVKPIKVLCAHAGRLGKDDGEIRYLGLKDLKLVLKNIDSFKDEIYGFIVPVPKISGPIWNDSLAKLSGGICDDSLYELFDHEIEKSSVRSWYYETAFKYILKTHMLPLKRFSKSIGKEIVFDLGNAEMQYDLMGNMITPGMLKKSGISMAVHKESSNSQKELGFSQDDFVISGNGLEKIQKCGNAKVLLIKPTRGIMERFVQGEVKGKPNRLETPALLSAIEGVYYCDMLSEMGYTFDVADEMHLPKESELKEYEHVLVCKSCLFTEKEKAKLDKLQKYGVKINDRDLICDLTEKGDN